MMNKQEKEFGYNLEGVAFGMTDGVICFLGIIIGVAKATQDLQMVIIASIVGGVADALGNSFGFLISQLTERSVQLHSKEDLGNTVRVHSTREVWMSGVFSFIATLIALIALIIPFFLFEFQLATISTFIVGVITLFILGMYVAKITGRNMIRLGATYALLGMLGTIVAFVVGDTLRRFTGIGY